MRKLLISLAITGVIPALAVEENQAKTFSELVAEGYEPFPVNGHDMLVTGMRNGADYYSCWLADTPDRNEARQGAILPYVMQNEPLGEVPNIELVCVKLQ